MNIHANFNGLASVFPEPQEDGICCGPDVCNLDFEDFMKLVRQSYPDMGHNGIEYTLKQDGVFDGLMKSLHKPLFDMYVKNCGLCDAAREMDPCLSCCTTDCWGEEYGLPDTCFNDELFQPCWLTEDQRTVSLKTQLCIRQYLEWNRDLRGDFFKRIADPLGIEFTIEAPTLSHNFDKVCIEEIVLPIVEQEAAPSRTRVRNDDGSITTCYVTDPNQPVENSTFLMTNPDFTCYRPQVRFRITCAPANVYATICSPLTQPFKWNPWVDAFKCIVQEVLPCNYVIQFCDEITRNKVPPFINNCPDACGRYKDPVFVGSGTAADPFDVDFSRLSDAQAIALAKKIACSRGI